ncbi:MAG TPA: 2Fe-2S iron-sulfur cluster binding domain-containing protein [Sporichthyaceae bacterium]|nr:2Fe-2S iron-sulfur cluster binding domain-containing protein [Sporichthyaceae bacterium]
MYEVRVEPFGHTFTCLEDETILEGARRHPVFLRYGCKNGACGTCKVQLVDGDVELAASSYALPPAERDRGTILVCQSYPVDDCVIDVAAMNLDEEEFYSGDKAGQYAMAVESNEALTPDIRRLILRHAEHVVMPFAAGQFVNVTVPGTDAERSYSMSNGSADNDRIELICKVIQGGLFSNFLTEHARPGVPVTVTGPFGLMSVRLSHRGIVMVAGGSGLAPLLSMLTDQAQRGAPREVTLFFGARTRQDLYGFDELAGLQTVLPDLRFVPVLEDPHPGWSGATGLVTEAIARYRTDWSGHDAYLCGPPGMIEAATELLVRRGVRAGNVYSDAFVPTGKTPVG